MLLKWEIILVATAIVLYDEANDFSGQNSNIETGVYSMHVQYSHLLAGATDSLHLAHLV